MKKPNKSTLADKIAGILNTAPTSVDPEDDAVDETTAPTLQTEDFDREEEEILSKFRRANVDLLEDLDVKYAGKKTSRKNLKDSDSEDSDLEADEESIEDNSQKSESEDYEDEVGSVEEETEDDEESDSVEDEEDENEDEDEEQLSEDEDNSNFRHLSDTNVSNQIKKGLCVRNQMAMWENLLEARIQLQKCLITANKMPQKEHFNEIKKSSPEFANKVSVTKAKLTDTLDKLLLLQNLLLKQFPETKKLDEVSEEKKEDEEEIPSDSDIEEEIPSDSDIEESTEAERTETEEPKPKKRKLQDYGREISDRHTKYKNYRNSVIQKWNDKTRLVVKGNVASHSVLEQIEYNLTNKEKLLKRTQLKKSNYAVLGEKEGNEDKPDEEYNSEIFDDDDFYHQLLRELIEVKSADVTDPVQLGRQWIQLQNMRSKMKRKIDTKATKGRKIRYAVHSKLVNFMAPIDKNLWTDEAKNELYNSLFGKNQPVFNVS